MSAPSRRQAAAIATAALGVVSGAVLAFAAVLVWRQPRRFRRVRSPHSSKGW